MERKNIQKGEKSGLDGGIEGRYNASHAEKQVSMFEGATEIGVSKEMCNDCQEYFNAKAKKDKTEYIVADPSETHIFTPYGEHKKRPRPKK